MPGINTIGIKSMSFGGRCALGSNPISDTAGYIHRPLPSGVEPSSLCSAFSLHLCSPWLYHSHSHTHTRCMCSLELPYFLLCFWARKALSPTPVIVTNSTSLSSSPGLYLCGYLAGSWSPLDPGPCCKMVANPPPQAKLLGGLSSLFGPLRGWWLCLGLLPSWQDL